MGCTVFKTPGLNPSSSVLSFSPWLVQKSQIYTWDGKMPLRWRKLENFKLELPRDTLLSVEIVQELKGEVRGGTGKR